jgi:hypothetical protein
MLAAAAANIRKQIHAPLTQAEQSTLDETLVNAWKALHESEGREAWALGYEMSLERAVQFSLEEA